MRREEPVAVMQSWLGVKEPDHKFIIDIYNSFFDTHGSRPRGYRVTYTDAWCATCVSAAIIEVGGWMDAPLECGCQEMINLYKEAGRYISGNAYAPQKGDVIFYDWQGDGHSDHVGIVEVCDGTNIVAIEGNNNDAVRRRTLRVGASYITGYGQPNYDESPAPVPVPIPEHITPDPVADADRVYRLYNPSTGEHFYTASVDEGNMLIDAGWSYEGSAWIAPKTSSMPVWRLINQAGGHLFTPDAEEKRILVESGWKEEGIAFYSSLPTDLPIIPIYRAYNPGNGDHLFSTNALEYYSLCSAGWQGEGIRFYGLR
ncbi:MAG: CHAP domain-containing protein [Bacteroidales bacterium]|nr:CHAP domain-containing protein [Bacteroidales bacterium]